MATDYTTQEISLADETSQEFLGRWTRLVSTTNWEKGRIIHQWREALVAAGAPVELYSDEAWAARVNNVSGQHVGRLRRAFERFGSVYENYSGLFWSHFQAALEWDDAEMWLEGAVQNDWSVADMRRSRGETLGKVAGESDDTEATALSDQFDEDSDSAEGATSRSNAATSTHSATDSGFSDYSGPIHEGPDFGDDGNGATTAVSSFADDGDDQLLAGEPLAVQRPFADLPTLPDDLSNIMEELKIAILRHKTTAWQHVQPNEVRAHLEAMMQLLVPAV
jgi:hypothetical protein